MHWFIAEESVWSNKGKERCGFELVLSKSLSSQFWFFFFHVSNTVVAVDLFVAVAAAAAAAAAAGVVVPVVGKDIQE